jgi:hypothetical protein
MKKPILFIASLLLMASVCTFQIDAGTSDAGGPQSPHGKNDNPAETLASLYAAVPGGGYIYVVTPGLTDPRVAIELVRAKKRGVDVRVIADRRGLEEYRERVALYNLKHYGIPVKINSRPGRVELKVSIVNDIYVVTGTYDYSPRRVSDHALIVTIQRDNSSVQEYKGLFDAMWHDGHSYKML